MRKSLHWLIAAALVFAAPVATAEFHTFVIDEVYSNADGTVQYVVLHEGGGFNGENLLGGHTLTGAHAGLTNVFVFPGDLPSSSTANRRVLIATQGFAALGLVTPDYTIPNGFLPTGAGTINYAGVSQLSYASLPTDGVNAINSNGSIVPNLATNFAGASAMVPPATTVTPQIGLWWNPNESGSGYALDFKHGVLVVAIYSYQPTGSAQWYLAAGPLSGTTFSATLDKYVGGQCISCAYTAPSLNGNDGTITINFSSATSATVSLPGGRVTQIQPTAF